MGAVGTLGTAAVVVYLSRSNRALIRAQAAKAEAEGEGASLSATLLFVQQMMADRAELRKQLEEAEKKAATTRAEREQLWNEKRLLQLDIEERDRSIRFLTRYLQDAGMEIPPEWKA